LEVLLVSEAPGILGLAAVVPPACYPQTQIYQLLRPYLSANPRSETIFDNAGVGSRHLVVDGSYYTVERTTQARNERYMIEALQLGKRAALACLERAGVAAVDVTDLIVVSCTGIDIPGLDLQIAAELSMSHWLRRTCVLGMGCYGAFPGLLRASEAALAGPHRLALVVCVEVCSLHFQAGDHSIENVVSSALFADGAAAVLIGTPRAGAPRLVDSATFCDYQTFDHMAFHLTDHGFRMSLSAYVPRLLAANVEEFVDQLLGRSSLSRQQVQYWGIHPGSSKILDFVEGRLALPSHALDSSRRVLFEYGNMSSATILFVLEDLLRTHSPEPGEHAVLLSFGPGLTMEGALVRF
jgi:alkylresorcinol/alkylpyrone synthase